jgi:hypothetical protein
MSKRAFIKAEKANRKASHLKSRLPVSEYPQAWAEYNQRWYAAWISLPLMFLSLLMAKAKLIGIGPAALAAIALAAAQLVLWLRFIQWPCPRCGNTFKSDATLHGKPIVRPDKCAYCGLLRNMVPGELKIAKLQDQDWGPKIERESIDRD